MRLFLYYCSLVAFFVVQGQSASINILQERLRDRKAHVETLLVAVQSKQTTTETLSALKTQIARVNNLCATNYKDNIDALQRDIEVLKGVLDDIPYKLNDKFGKDYEHYNNLVDLSSCSLMYAECLLENKGVFLRRSYFQRLGKQGITILNTLSTLRVVNPISIWYLGVNTLKWHLTNLSLELDASLECMG